METSVGKLIWVVSRIHSLAVENLKSKFSCMLLAGPHFQSLDTTLGVQSPGFLETWKVIDSNSAGESLISALPDSFHC